MGRDERLNGEARSKLLTETATDTRVAYGANCTWWGNIQQVGTKEGRTALGKAYALPCCPTCHGMLFEVESEALWLSQAQAYEDEGHPGYVAFMTWAKGKCEPGGWAVLKAVYDIEGGTDGARKA